MQVVTTSCSNWWGWVGLSEKEILKFLQNLGFSKRENQVYLFLAKSGAQSTSFVAKRLKMERVQAYRTFKKLQEKGFIQATLERPTRFTVVPFETLLETYIETKKSEIDNLYNQKKELLLSWQNLNTPESDYAVAKFSIIGGKKKIHVKMLNMIEESQKTLCVLTTVLGVIQEDIGGILDTLIHKAVTKNIESRLIVDISADNLKILERFCKKIITEKAPVEARHLNLDSKFFPRFLIKDDEEAILYASSEEETSVLNIEDEGLWINDKMFISVLKAFFSQMWQTGVNVNRRIDELKTGIPIGETIVIKDPNSAWAKVEQTLNAAERDVILITSSQSILSMTENDPFAKYHKEGVTFRLMAPMDLENLEAAKKLSNNYKIKHVPINYMTMMLVDDYKLFMFKSPPLNDLTDESFFYLTDTFYTNDPRSSERVSEMLNDTWKRGTELSEITSQAGMKLPTLEIQHNQLISEVVSLLIKKNVTQVLIMKNDNPIGIITDRDILKDVIEKKKNPDETLAKDLDYTPLLTLKGTESMTDALKIMRQKGHNRIAVIKHGQLMGMLTQNHSKKGLPKDINLKRET